MTEFPERRTTRAAGWARRTATFSAVLLVSVWVGHHFGLVEHLAYLWVLAIVALLAAAALIFAAFAFSKLWQYGDLGGRDLTVGALVALVVLAPYGAVAYRIAAYPPLHDISTDLDDPPPLPVVEQPAPGMNVPVAPTPGEQRLQGETYPLATGHRYDAPFDAVVDAVGTVLRKHGWQLTAPIPAADAAQDPLVIAAYARSFVLELPVDVAIRISSDDDATLVDMRSASRYGRYDLGDNAARIVDFLAELDQQVNGQAAPPPAE
ncbi:MAG: DUF1499 domain-containing protein [Mesorhizobium sp.]|nr:DUF1499 domain-containing protein [Mesorhizobium sp.]MBN9244827.1 DUF1499 domain-containing protein [Mesorhizobium sp.]